jgi:hypothetical protein
LRSQEARFPLRCFAQAFSAAASICLFVSRFDPPFAPAPSGGKVNRAIATGGTDGTAKWVNVPVWAASVVVNVSSGP